MEFDDVLDEVESIATTVPVLKYWDNEGNALLLSADLSYVIMVTHNEGSTPIVGTAYTSATPVQDEGFESGFTT